jgi:hypothetical protein
LQNRLGSAPRPVAASTGRTVFMCETSDSHTGYTA